MASFVRPIVISLLCGMAAIGHAPAWLHVAGCDHASHWQVNSEAASIDSSDCHHGCCHHATVETNRGPEETTEEGSSHSHDGHDSGSCVLCQSFGVPNGVAWQLPTLSVIRTDFEITEISGLVAPESNFRSIRQPRGPPTPLA